jgi:phosphoenolpyruvate carboxylase
LGTAVVAKSVAMLASLVPENSNYSTHFFQSTPLSISSRTALMTRPNNPQRE